MKTLNRRVFIGTTASLAAAAVLPALTGSQVLRHGPVDIKTVSFFGPGSLKAMLISDVRKNTFSLLPLGVEGDVERVEMPLDQIASIVRRRGQGEFAVRVKGRQIRNFRSLLQAQRKWSHVVRLMDADDVAKGNKPGGVFLRLKDIQAVLPKA